jgi:hypothetical protein
MELEPGGSKHLYCINCKKKSQSSNSKKKLWPPPHRTSRSVLWVFPCVLPAPTTKTQRIASRFATVPPNPIKSGQVSPISGSPFLFLFPRARSPPRVGPRSRWPRAAAPCSRSSSSATAGERFGSPSPLRGLCLCLSLTSASCDLGLGRRL